MATSPAIPACVKQIHHEETESQNGREQRWYRGNEQNLRDQ